MFSRFGVVALAGMMMVPGAPSLVAGEAWDELRHVCEQPRRDPAAAVRACTRLITQHRAPRKMRASYHFERGRAWVAQKRYGKAVADLGKAIELDPDNAAAHYVRGVVWDELGEYDKAIADYTRVIAFNPAFAIAYHNRGVAWARKGEYDKAIADYTRAIERAPERAPTYYNRGRAWSDKGEHDKAIVDFERTIALDPTFAPAYGKLVDIRTARNEPEKAMAVLERFAAAHPSSAPARRTLAVFQMRLKKYAPAARNFRRAADLARDARYKRDRLIDLGHAYLSLDDVDKLADSAREALKITPLKPDFHALHHRALVFLMKKDYPQARTQLREIIRLSREHPDAFEAAQYERRAADNLRRLSKMMGE